MAEKIKDIMIRIMPKITTRSNVAEYPTGLTKLDDILWGFKRTETYIIAGRPSQGKSALSVYIGWYLSNACNKKVALFSLEMSKDQLGERCLALACEMNNEDIQRGGLTPEKIEVLNNYLDDGTDPDLRVADEDGFKFEDIENYIKANNPDIVIVDYVQMISPKKGLQEREVYGEYTREMKRMAKLYNIPILINSQINRGGEGTDPKEIPKLSSMKGSGTLEENVDGCLIVHWNWRLGAKKKDSEGNDVDYPKDEYQIYVAKNRNGRTGVATVSFIPEWYKFKNTF